jgi:hypothetical protein
MYYFIYKTTNKINQKYYYGAHTTTDMNDGYLGSGVALKKAIKKYGKENFYREIIELCDNENEMYLKEEQIVAENYKKDDCYNMNVGGRGGWNYVNANGLCKGDNNIMRKSSEVRDLVSKKGKETRKNNPEKYYKIAKKNLEKALKINTGKKRPEHAQFMKDWATQYWKENKEYIRNCLSSSFKITSPSGKEYITSRLEDWCNENELPYSTIWVSSSKKGKTITKGKAKGWKCELI